jgi:hypothetical protein
MDIEAISSSLTDYINSHRAELARLPVIQSQLLELGALVLSAEHYKLNGYRIEVSNLVKGKFRVKRTSGGKPWNFSWFTATRGRHKIEIHANLPVTGSYGRDGARYVVDVAVCKSNFLPIRIEERRTWASAENQTVITFVEAKKLTIYPMLLAQFIGIVHEIQPRFLGGRNIEGFAAGKHFSPTLVTTGPWAKSCEQIYAGFRPRRFRVMVIPNLDIALAGLGSGVTSTSPFTSVR